MTQEPNQRSEDLAEKSTKDRIREAAIDLFSQRGYSEVSIREIAREVGITESSIYSHYRGKEDIMNSIIDYLVEISASDTEEIPIEVMIEKFGPQELVKFTGKAILDRLRIPGIRKIARLMCIELFRNERIQDFFQNIFIAGSYDSWERIFQKMIDLGYFRGVYARTLAEEFFDYCIFLYFDVFVIYYDEDHFEAVVDNIVDKLTKHIDFMFKVSGVSEKRGEDNSK